MKLFLLAALLATFVAGGARGGDGLSGKKLTVGTMPNALGLPLRYAMVAGFFKDAGLDVDLLVFPTGAPINEAMAAEELDIGASGMATVYALATGRFTYIGDGMITIGGESIFARPDSAIAKVKTGKIHGDAATVKGAKILGPVSTAAQFHAIKYADAFGLTPDDFVMVGMDYASAAQAFVTGQGDLVCLSVPFSNQLAARGFVIASDLGQGLDITLVDSVFTQNRLVKERRPDLVAFLDCYYRACDTLNKDEELRRKVGREWYAEEGRTVTDEEMDWEISQKTYNTLDTLLTPGHEFGENILSIGEFFTGQGMIRERNFQNIGKSLDTSLVKELKAKYGKN